MNLFRSNFHFLVVAVVLCVGSARAMFEEDRKPRYSFGSCTASFFVTEVPKEHQFLKSSIETCGYAFDNIDRYKRMVEKRHEYHQGMISTDYVLYQDVAFELTKHFLINYGIRKGSQELYDQGLTFESAANKCDILPEGTVRDVVNPTVRAIGKIITHPEVLTFVALSMLHTKNK